MIIKIMQGETAPNFSLPASDGNTYTLDSFQNNGLVLFFYNKDNTPNCSKEAVDFSNHLPQFKQLGYDVAGVSPDSAEMHRKFLAKKGINILLLADKTYEVATAYGSYGVRKLFSSASSGIIRSTFVISKNRDVLMANYHVDVTHHAQDVLDFIEQHHTSTNASTNTSQQTHN